MAHNCQPPGLCFHPTDEELVGYYLKRKVYGRRLIPDIIPEVDPYKYEPWDLPGKSCIRGRGSKLYFFSPAKGHQSFRATEAGSWKTTGRDQTISACSGGVRAIKKTKIFHRKHGGKTNWRMHEYILNHDDSTLVQNSLVLCKIFQKPAPKRDEGCTSEVPCTEAGVRSSLGVESDSLSTQPTDVSNHQEKTLMEDTDKYSGDFPPPDDDIQMFLMRNLCDREDLIPNTEENGLRETSVYENQPLMVVKGTSVNGKCKTSGVDNLHVQETVIAKDKTPEASSSLTDQQDTRREILEGDYIELNDMLTPLDTDFSSRDIHQ